MPADDVDVRIRLRDSRQFIGEAARASAALRGVGSAASVADRAGRGLTAASARVATGLGRLAVLGRRAALGIGGALTVGAGMGVRFQATMETNTVAFKTFLGSAEAAEQHLDRLYKMAATTPFEFPDLVAGSRRLLAFGMSAKESNGWLATIGDTVAGIGGGTEEINRMVGAIGQIQAKGKASTEEMLQLAELGIPAFEALGKATGRTQEQVFKDLSAGAISSDEALKALRGSLAKTFGGSSAAQSKTFSGQISTLKDNLTALLGEASKPLFDYLRATALPVLNDLVDGFRSGAGRGGALRDFLASLSARVRELAPVVIDLAKRGFAYAKDAVGGFLDALRPAQPFFANVLLPLLKGVAQGIAVTLAGAFAVIVPVLRLFMAALGWIGKAAAPLKPVFQGIGLVLGSIILGPIAKGLAVLPKLGFVFRIIGGAVSFVGKILRVAFAALSRFGGLAVRVGGWIAARLTAPIRTVAAFVAARIPVAFRIATAPLRAFLGVAGRVGSGIVRAFGRVVAFFAGLGGKIARSTRGAFDGLRAAFAGAYNAIAGAWNRLELSLNIPDAIPGLPDRITIGTPNLPLLAAGGVIRGAGGVIVGDRGPEVLSLPRAARVDPLPGPAPLGSELAGGTVTIRVPVFLDRRQIAEAVGDYTRGRLERR